MKKTLLLLLLLSATLVSCSMGDGDTRRYKVKDLKTGATSFEYLDNKHTIGDTADCGCGKIALIVDTIAAE